MQPLAKQSRAAHVGGLLLLATLYAASGRLGQYAAIPPGHVTLIWPASGIALAAALVYGNRVWPGIWLGSFLVNNWVYFDNTHSLSSWQSFVASAAIGLGATLGTLTGAYLLRRTVGGTNFFDRAEDVVRFLVLGAMGSSLVSPTVGVTSLCMAGIQTWSDFGSSWWTWWLGDTAGVLVVTPLLLTWRNSPSAAGDPKRVAEAVAAFALVIVTSVIAFWGRYPVVYVVIPALVWVALRFGHRGATAASFLVSLIAILGTIDGTGPFAISALTLNESLLMLQLFMGIVVMTTLLLTAVVVERQSIAEALRLSSIELEMEILERREAVTVLQRAHDELETRVQERTADLAKLNGALESEIAERRQAQIELQAAKEAAEVANRAKSVFLANMSHELRTPMNAVLGFAQMMARDRGLTAEHRDHLSVIMRSGEYLLGLINDVLSISKIEAGKIELTERTFDLHRLLQGVEEMVQARARAKGLAHGFELAADLPQHVTGDEGKLRQVLVNLLTNAVKFTDRGTVALRARWRDGLGTFEVADTGKGMAAHELDTLFEPFVQTASGRKSSEGTGLGLAISRDYVRLMGGDIRVESESGKGTTIRFDVKLPAAEAPAHAEASRPVVGLEPGQPDYRILVVDDLLESRMPLVRLLASVGFDVREAVNGKEAVAVHREWHPDLIWMDMRMPVMDGYTATKTIRNTERGAANGESAAPVTPESRTRRCVIIALTASAFEHDGETILAAGCDGYVTKPYREATIFDVLARHLGARFRFEDAAEAPPSAVAADDAEGPVTPERMQEVPRDLLEALNRSVTEGDVEMAVKVTERIGAVDESLAAELKRMVRSYRFEEIQELTGGY